MHKTKFATSFARVFVKLYLLNSIITIVSRSRMIHNIKVQSTVSINSAFVYIYIYKIGRQNTKETKLNHAMDSQKT